MFKWMFLPLKRYAEFSGRSRRKEFWMWFLFTQSLALIIMSPLISGALKIISAVAEVFPDELSEAELEFLILDSFSPTLLLATLGILVLTTLAFIVPNVALLLRRFLDANIESKWFWILLVACFVPFFGGVAALAIIIITGFVPGTPGPNNFGDDPRAESEPTLASSETARAWPTS